MRNRRTGPFAVLAALVGAVLTLGLVLAAAPAQADDGDGNESAKTLRVRLIDTKSGDTPVEGAVITVETADGDTFEGTTDSDGQLVLEFTSPAGKPIKVSLDESTLPDGAELRPGAKTELTLNGLTSTITANFAIGPDNRNVQGKLDRVPRSIYNGLLFGLILAMAALGLSMIFGTTGLTNFAHGELVTFGAMSTYLLNGKLGVPFVLAVLITVVVAAGFGWVQDRVLWAPLRHRGIGLIAMMIVSIGLQFLLRNVFAYITSSRLQNYDEFLSPEGHDFFGLFTYTWRDIVLALVSIAVLVGAILALSFTRIGRATRAVADNPALAAASGINVDRVVSLVWMVGTALAALAGSFLAFQLGVTYQIGQLVLLLLFASVCVGGLGSVWGALVGSLIIGVLIELSTLVIPADLKTAGALFLLIVILLVRPQGLLGRPERIG
ncbi:MAG TPA: branched-chain amino acid ABC transporter permease [Nocardioides sp.]|nr:branched-chain amino acid ABC transporter permease [Nocardioides sp.]